MVREHGQGWLRSKSRMMTRLDSIVVWLCDLEERQREEERERVRRETRRDSNGEAEAETDRLNE